MNLIFFGILAGHQIGVACNKLGKIWKSSPCRELKGRIFLTTVERVFLYGSETWTLTKSTEKKVDGACTNLLRTALINVSWREHIPIKDLYGYLPKVSGKIRERRMRLAGHFVTHKEERGH